MEVWGGKGGTLKEYHLLKIRFVVRWMGTYNGLQEIFFKKWKDITMFKLRDPWIAVNFPFITVL